MSKKTKKLLSILFSVTLLAALFINNQVPADTTYAAEEVTIIGTIQQTRTYYWVDGSVSAYCFFPSTLNTYKIGGKQVELLECGVGTTPEKLGTNDLSSYVGVTGAYTGLLAKSTAAPFAYTFVISSVTPAAPATMAEMDAYFKALGFEGVPQDNGDNTFYAGYFGWNKTVAFSYNCKGNCCGEINAYILKEGGVADFGLDSSRFATNAKAMQVAKKLAQYGNGEITREKLQKYLNSL